MGSTRDQERWLDRRDNISKIYWGVWLLSGVLVLIEPLVAKHPYFAFEGWFAFHGVFGFVACVALVLAAKGLRRILKRPEGYYGRD